VEFIFSAFNAFTLAFALVTAAILFLIACESYQKQVRNFVEAEGSTLEDHKAAANMRTDRLFFRGLGVIGLVAVSAMIVNIPFRIEAIRSETAITALSNKIENLSETRLGERCAFNGTLVSDTWIAGDTFPCKSFGGFRIWSNGAATISKSAVSVGRKFTIGRVENENHVERMFTVNFDLTRYGIKGDYAEFDTPLDTDGVLDLIRQLGGV
jgi:hypothetical protein